MNTRQFALLYGILFGLVGVAGFIPSLLTPPAPGDPPLAVETGHALLFGLFPVNLLHNLFHLAFAVWGIAAYASFGAARLYARAVAIIYGLLTIMGFVPVLNTTFGLIPIHSADIGLHLVLALVAAYFGFRSTSPADEPATTRPVRR